MVMDPTPFSVHIGDDVLADLKARLSRVRWPDEVPDNHWKFGTDLPYLKSLVQYWRDGQGGDPADAFIVIAPSLNRGARSWRLLRAQSSSPSPFNILGSCFFTRDARVADCLAPLKCSR